ncbi:ATP-binding protein [Actinomadura decatromicini]|uniref:ATP-binding protein n=1 Tax=Actinomadura decatromicini TaxID=2604572 RepID=A0A5D3FCS3_9ACTN|nr:ATP-binding protein [Actinomadura decatromicini]TYK45125.1 ATP-binding protein [Actinomadura decatromicini]
MFVKVDPPKRETPDTVPQVDDVVDDAEDGADQEHGDWAPESVGARLQRSLHATAWRCRRPLLPHLIAGGVAGGGFASQAITAAGAVSAPGMATILAGLAFPSAFAAVKATKRHRRRLGHRVLLGGLFAAGWLTLAPYGIGAGDLAVLGTVEVALAARWWQHVRLGYPAPQEPNVEEPEVEPVNRATQIISDWAAYIGGQGCALPGSALTLPMPTEHGYAFTAQLARGKQSLRSVVAALPMISTGLEEPLEHLIAESAPPDPVTGKSFPSRCRFQVVTRSPVTGNVDFDGPRRDGGLIGLGPWADGSGEAQTRLYTEGSMWSTVIIGETGSGKSRVAENKVISALSGGDTVYWYLDPQGGASSPALAKHADWFGTLRDAGDMANAAVAILDARGEENSIEGWTGFTPSPDRPGLLIVVEECHDPFDQPTWTPLWTRIAREGRKVGVALLCLSQYPGVKTFGSEEALRMNVMAGNTIVLHTTSNSAGQLMPGLDVDPQTLPNIPGYCYVQGSPQTGTRTAPFRNRNTTPEGRKDLAEQWLARQPQPRLDTLAVTATLAAGTAYRDRHTSTSSGRAASATRVEALRSGALPEDLRAPQPTPARASVGEMGKLIEFPRALVPADLESTAPLAPRGPLSELTGSRLAVVQAVAAGATRPKEIEAATGLKHRQCADLLKELVASGHLTQPRYGRYQAAA